MLPPTTLTWFMQELSFRRTPTPFGLQTVYLQDRQSNRKLKYIETYKPARDSDLSTGGRCEGRARLKGVRLPAVRVRVERSKAQALVAGASGGPD